MDESKVKIAIERLQKLAADKDFEKAHSEADDILCKLLIDLGYSAVVEAWEAINKYCA